MLSTSERRLLTITPPSCVSTLLIFIASSTALLVLSPAVFRYWFPTTAFCSATYLFRRDKALYISFAWWLWFITPLLRRIVDYRTEFVAQDPILLAPVLVAAISLVCAAHLRFESRELLFIFPMLSLLITFGYSLLIGNGPQTSVLQLLLWLGPITFGLCIYQQWRNLDVIFSAVHKTALYGLLVVGLYGIVQFFVGPPWDMAWLQNAIDSDLPGIPSTGIPAPMQFRVFSTMNSQQPMASALIFALFVVLVDRRLIARVASALALIAILLSGARAAWLEYLVGICMFVAFARKYRITVRALAPLIFLAPLVPIVLNSPAADQLSSRLASIREASDDYSYIARLSGYRDLTSRSLHTPLGLGFGVLDREAVNQDKGAIGPHDSSILELVLTLGWVGAGCLIVCLAKIALSVLNTVRCQNNQQVIALGALFCSILVASFFNSFVGGAPGAALGTCIGLLLAVGRNASSRPSNPVPPAKVPVVLLA